MGIEGTRLRAVVAVVVLALVGCSSTPKSTAPTPAPTATAAAAGPSAFLAFARAASFGSKDFSLATDAQLLDIANLACDEGLGAGLPFGRVVQGYVESNAKPSTPEAEAFARAAVTNLCPEYAAQVPK